MESKKHARNAPELAAPAGSKFLSLPSHIICHTLSWLDGRSLACFSRSHSTKLSSVNLDGLWQRAYRSDFPDYPVLTHQAESSWIKRYSRRARIERNWRKGCFVQRTTAIPVDAEVLTVDEQIIFIRCLDQQTKQQISVMDLHHLTVGGTWEIASCHNVYFDGSVLVAQQEDGNAMSTWSLDGKQLSRLALPAEQRSAHRIYTLGDDKLLMITQRMDTVWRWDTSSTAVQTFSVPRKEWHCVFKHGQRFITFINARGTATETRCFDPLTFSTLWTAQHAAFHWDSSTSDALLACRGESITICDSAGNIRDWKASLEKSAEVLHAQLRGKEVLVSQTSGALHLLSPTWQCTLLRGLDSNVYSVPNLSAAAYCVLNSGREVVVLDFDR